MFGFPGLVLAAVSLEMARFLAEIWPVGDERSPGIGSPQKAGDAIADGYSVNLAAILPAA